jgi:hypothetical protein
MHEQPRRILCELIRQHGPELHADARRTEALLRDLCAAYPREIFVLIHAQKQRIPADLLAAPRWMPQQALTTQLTRRLQENLALAEEAADWAVESWAIALNIKPAAPDRAWLWTKQQLRVPPIIRASTQLTGKLPGWGKRLFHHFSVKLNQQPSSVSIQSNMHPLQWTTIAGWLEQVGREMRRPRLRITMLVVFCALLAVGAVNQTAPSMSSAETQVVQPSVADQLAVAYPLPRPAWVNEDQLMIRSGPSTATGAIGSLIRGQQ